VGERRRVVVTGVGVVSPLGTRDAFFAGLAAGRSGIGPIDWFDPGPGPCRLAFRARDWDPKRAVPPALLRRMDHVSQMVVCAAREALDDAALALDGPAAEAAGIVLGTAFGDLVETEEFLGRLVAKGPGLVNPLVFPNLVLNAPTGYVSIELGIRGPNMTVCRGEASGEAALATAYDAIVSGHARVLLAGAADEISPVLFHVYKDAGVLSPSRASRRRSGDAREWSSPFDRRRNGLVMGEGAAMLVLEDAEHAAARSARVYAELAGWASQALPCDPYDWPRAADAAPAETGRQLAALGWTPPSAGDEMHLVISSANSTERLDAYEARHLAGLLGEASRRVLVTSVKGAVGECGGTGALGAAAAVLAIATGDVPRLGALDERDPQCTLHLATADTPPPPAGVAAALVSGTPRGGACLTLLRRRP
jgi:3-oxoacyl-[acyl-carrier-protein] synthase II